MSKKLYVLVVVILLFLIIVSLFFIIKPFFEKWEKQQEFFDTTEFVEDSRGESGIEGNATLIEVPIDFQKLWETNTDVYAWISIPGTNIDYPIVQNEDNTYYLNHTWDKKEYKAGSIFTETYNHKSFEDPNTVIYGHRMYAGDMFAMLQNFSEADFFDKNRYFYIYTPASILTYEIVAAVPFSDRHLLFEYNFADGEDFDRFCNDVFSTVDFRACFLEETELRYGEDRLVTLSSCLKGNSNKRYLVIGRLISEEK